MHFQSILQIMSVVLTKKSKNGWGKMNKEKTNKKIKLTFDYNILTPVRTTGVFDEKSNGWKDVFRMFYSCREDLEMNGSLGGGFRPTLLFEKDVPQLVEEPPHNKCVRVSGIEVYEEDEDGNKTEPRKLQYKDFPTKKDWEIRKEEYQRDNPNHQSPSGIQRWLDHRKKYISDPQFVLHVQHLFFHDTKSL